MDMQEMEKGFQEIWKLFAESDRRMTRTERQLAEFTKDTDRKNGELSSKWGRFVEGLVVPAAKRLFRARGIVVDKVYQRVKTPEMEIDLLAIDGRYAVLIEVKSTLTVEDVRDHLERLEKFKTVFPEYADREVIGAVAGIVIDENVDRFAYKKGLFVIAQSGETVKFLNDEKFTPRVW